MFYHIKNTISQLQYYTEQIGRITQKETKLHGT